MNTRVMNLLVLAAVLPLCGQAAPFSKCDVNQSGATDAADVQLMINQALGNAPPLNDLNGDGVVNVVDIEIDIDAAAGMGCIVDPHLVSINPGTGQQGQQNQTVNVTGQLTNFVQGLTTASFGANVNVVTVTINSPTTATVVLSIDAAASTGNRTVTFTTSSEVAILANGFSVTAGTPTIVTVNPNIGQPGQQNETVNVTGQFTHFAQGTTTASFGNHVHVGTLTINSPTTATVVLNIDAAASTGNRNVTFTTGAEEATLAQGFAVSQSIPAPTISIDSPTPGSQINQPTDLYVTIANNAPGGGAIAWTVGLLRANTVGPIQLGSGTGPIADISVGTIDPTLLANDNYTVIVTAVQSGQTTTAQFSFDITSANLKLGNYTTTFADIAVQIGGLTITLLREYNSLDVSQGDFGCGWWLKLPGRVSDSAAATAPFTTSTRVYVTRPDGVSEGFTFNDPPESFPFFGNYPALTPDPGVTDTLTPPITSIFCNNNGCFDVYGNTYHPTTFVLQTKDNFQYTIDELAGLQQIQDPNGNTITVSPTGLVSSTGLSVPFTRDTQGRITSIQGPGAGPNPPTVNYAYDANGNLVSFFDQLNNQTQYFYQNASFPHYLTKAVDPLGRPLIQNVYDDSGHLIATCNANGNVNTLAGCTRFSQDSISLRQTIISPRGFQEDFFLDSQGNLLVDRHYMDLGDTTYLDTVRTYDANNNMVTMQDPAGNITSYTYDGNGNALTATRPGNRTTTYTYNSCNQITTKTDPDGNAISNGFDGNCNVLSQTDALGNTANYQYNTFGEVTSSVDALGNQRTWTYDANGLLTTYTDPFGLVTTFQFDSSGYPLSRTDRNGHRIDYQYDAAHNLVTETWNTTPPTVKIYSYDAAGELTGVSSPVSSTTLTYDQLGRLITEDNLGTPGATRVILNYSYDADGNITGFQDSTGGSTQYTFDGLDRMTQIVQTGTGVSAKSVGVVYDASNLITQINRFADAAGNSPVAKTLFQYDCGGCGNRVTAIQHLRSADSSPIDNLSYVYDPAGNISSSTDAEGAHQYTYDANRRLLTANHTQTAIQPNESYTYDAVGNRLSSQRSPNYIFSYMTTGSGNRLTGDANFTYTYDGEGNLTQRTSLADGSQTNYTWDYLNHLASMVQTTATDAQTASETYVYDSAGRRIRTVRPQAVEQYFYFGMNLALVLDGSGDVLTRGLFGRRTDELYAQEQAGQTSWMLSDRVHSVRDTISNTATVLNHFAYDSFGNLQAHSSALTPTEPLFTGGEFSTASMLGYFRARNYSPDTGRFLSEDRLAPYNYDYAGNNPIAFTDPLGLMLVEDTEVSATVITGSAVGNGVTLQGESMAFYNLLRAEAQLLRAEIEQLVAAGFGGTPLQRALTLQLLDLEQFAESLWWEGGLPSVW